MSKTTFSKSVIDDIQLEKLLKIHNLSTVNVTTATTLINVATRAYQLNMSLNTTIVLSITDADPARKHINLDLCIVQDTTGGRVITFPSNVTLAGTLSTVANSYSMITLNSIDNGITWIGKVEYTGSLKQYVPTPVDPNLNYKTPMYIGASRLINGTDDTLYCHSSTISGDMLIQIACPWDGKKLADGWTLHVDGSNVASDYYGMKVGIFWKIAGANGRQAHLRAGCDTAYLNRTPSWFTCAVYTWRFVNPITPWGTSIYSVNGTASSIIADQLTYNVTAANARVILTHNRSEADLIAPSGVTKCAMSNSADYFWPYGSLISLYQNTIDKNQITISKTSRVTTPSATHDNTFKSFVFNGELKAMTFGKTENVTYANRIIVHGENANMRNMMPNVSTYLAGYPNQRSVFISYPNSAVLDSTKGMSTLRNGQRYLDIISPVHVVGSSDFTIEFYFLFPGTAYVNCGIMSSIPLYDGVDKTNGMCIYLNSVNGTNITLGAIVGRKQTGYSSTITTTNTINGTVYNHCSLTRKGNKAYMHINGTYAGSVTMDPLSTNFDITNKVMRTGHFYNTAFLYSNDVIIDEYRFVNGEALYTENVNYTRPNRVS